MKKLAEQQRHNVVSELEQGVPLIGGLAAAIWALWRFRQDRRHNIQLKALEIAMTGESPGLVWNRLMLIRELIPEVPKPNVDKQNIDQWGLGQSASRRQFLLNQLAAAPSDRREAILADWHTVFPNDVWVESDTLTGGHKLVDPESIWKAIAERERLSRPVKR